MSMAELVNNVGAAVIVFLGAVYVLIGSCMVAAEREDRRRRAAAGQEEAI